MWLHEKQLQINSIDLSRQKELDADPIAILQIEFFGKLKRLDNYGNATDAGKEKSTIVLKILEKIKETKET